MPPSQSGEHSQGPQPDQAAKSASSGCASGTITRQTPYTCELNVPWIKLASKTLLKRNAALHSRQDKHFAFLDRLR